MRDVENIARARATRLFEAGDIGNDFVPDDDGAYHPGFVFPLTFRLWREDASTRVLFSSEAGRARFADTMIRLGGIVTTSARRDR